MDVGGSGRRHRSGQDGSDHDRHVEYYNRTAAPEELVANWDYASTILAERDGPER